MASKTRVLKRLGPGLATAIVAAALVAPMATARPASSYRPPDPWFAYATSLNRTQTPDPWLNYALDATQARGSNGQDHHANSNTRTRHALPARPRSYQFITDTLAPGGGRHIPMRSYQFITDTLAPGGGSN